jgi:5'-deoxynucleotidase YfbR-like HD superfamily hydrolase
MSGSLIRLKHTYRYSSVPVLVRENVAEHSFWTAIIGVAIAIEMQMSRQQIGKVALKALLHDVEESMTGDLIRDMKYHNEETREAIASVENEFAMRIFEGLGTTLGRWFESFWRQSKDSSPTGRVVALADLLCVISYVEHEWNLGNRNDQLSQIHDDCVKLIESKFLATDLEEIAMEAIK